MTLSRRVSIIGICLASCVLVWNLITPGNPDHALNLIVATILTVWMVACLFLPERISQVSHSLTLGGSAFVYVGIDGGFFSSGTLTIILFVLIHAYGAFRTHALWKLPLSVLAVYILSSVSSAHFTVPGIEAYGRAAMWTLMVIGFLFVLWCALQEFRRQFHEEYASAIIQQNRQLLELNKQLAGGCDDAKHP